MAASIFKNRRSLRGRSLREGSKESNSGSTAPLTGTKAIQTSQPHRENLENETRTNRAAVTRTGSRRDGGLAL